MTAHLAKHKSKKRISKSTLFIFYVILYFDKFKIRVCNSCIVKRIRKFVDRIRDIFHWHLRHPDLYFEDKWETNEFYPFIEDKFKQFTIKVRDRWFYPVTIVFVVATIFGIVRGYSSKAVNDILIHLIIFVTGITSLILWKKQLLIIDQGAEEYVIIWYNTILFSQPIHNIYLRMYEIRQSPADPSYYQLVVQATKLPAVSITRLSTDEERIRRIGHILSEKININFFEFEDLSHNHVIRHWPILPPDDETNISPPPKTDFFQIKSMRAFFHAGSGLAIKSFYEFEKMITGAQLSKKGSEQMSFSSLTTAKSSGRDSVSEKNFSWKKKPLKFFKRIFPKSKKGNAASLDDFNSESSLERPGTSYRSPSAHQRFSDGAGPTLTKRNPHKSASTSDAFNQRQFLRELHRKIQSAQAESSNESLSSLSEVSIIPEPSDTESDNDKDYDRILENKV